MGLAKAFASVLRRFGPAARGTTAVTFALSAVPMLLAAGAAIDYVRYASAETELQAALDAAALSVAAAADLSNAARVAAGEAAFDRNIAGQMDEASNVTRSFSFAGGAVKASASVELPTSLMRIAGLDKMTIDASTEISIPDKKSAEVVLVLDYSGSMKEVLGGQVKYIAMKNAAKNLVNDLHTANPKNIKYGLVPFSHHVWVSMPKQYVAGQTGAGTWTGCTQDRQYPYNLTDDSPTTDDATKWGQPIAKLHAKDGCGAYAPNHLEVLPLTNDFTAVDSQLDAMIPYAWTHIALGAEFGFQLLSPNEPFAEAVPYSDTKTKKFMVLLTDGEQTEPAYGPGVRTVAQGNKNLTAICDSAKARGITVMTIAYNIDDVTTVNRLRKCTSDPDKDFFNIDSDNNIAAAFEEIKEQIAAKVFISR